ncbi:MAG: HD domain-containing protein, partial [Eubacteriales bacterium]
RRDFTINALYYDILGEELVDPLGGVEDVFAMRIRAAKENAEETLNDDGLRIVRMARFAAELNFMVDPALCQAARKFSYYLSDITPDRKQIELKKILLSDIKYKSFKGAINASKPKKGMMILKESGALKFVIPDLCLGAGVKQNEKYHAHDVLMHGICVMAETPPDYALRLAGLMHDIAKPFVLEQTGKMVGHDVAGETLARKTLNDLRTPKAVIKETVLLIRNHMFDLKGEAKTNTIKKKAGEMGFDHFRKLIALRRADVAGSGMNTEDASADHWERVLNEMISSHTPKTIADLDIDGKTLMAALSISEGEKVGQLLKRLHARVLLSPGQNKKEQLIVLAKQILKEL